MRRRLRCTTTAACESVGSQVELHDLRSVAFNCQRGTVVGPIWSKAATQLRSS